MSDSLAIMSKANIMLAEADTVLKCKELRDMALTAADWAKRRKLGDDAVRHAESYALMSERKMGEMLLAVEPALLANRKKGLKFGPEEPRPTEEPTVSLQDLGVTANEKYRATTLAKMPDAVFECVKEGKQKRADAVRDMKRIEIVARLEDIKAVEAKALEGVFDVVVVDPPWAIQKIERDCRPNQVKHLDYPTMSLEEISAMKLPMADDCHVFCWTTQRFLPPTFGILEAWGLKYVLAFVWHKPGGFQPIGLPQYNVEFCLYARKGTPKFVDTKAFPAGFYAERGRHSEKPEEFYDMVRRVTAGRRADVFNRRPIKGFESWGNEAK